MPQKSGFCFLVCTHCEKEFRCLLEAKDRTLYCSATCRKLKWKLEYEKNKNVKPKNKCKDEVYIPSFKPITSYYNMYTGKYTERPCDHYVYGWFSQITSRLPFYIGAGTFNRIIQRHLDKDNRPMFCEQHRTNKTYYVIFRDNLTYDAARALESTLIRTFMYLGAPLTNQHELSSIELPDNFENLT